MNRTDTGKRYLQHPHEATNCPGRRWPKQAINLALTIGTYWQLYSLPVGLLRRPWPAGIRPDMRSERISA